MDHKDLAKMVDMKPIHSLVCFKAMVQAVRQGCDKDVNLFIKGELMCELNHEF